jgi:hypothetical protein
MCDSSKWVKGRWIILLVILWLAPRPCHIDNQDDWSPPLTYFQVVASYNPGKNNVPVSDAVTEVWQPLIACTMHMLVSLNTKYHCYVPPVDLSPVSCPIDVNICRVQPHNPCNRSPAIVKACKWAELSTAQWHMSHDSSVICFFFFHTKQTGVPHNILEPTTGVTFFNRGHLLQQWLQEWPHRFISFYSTSHSRWKEVSSTKLQFKDRENPMWRWILDAVGCCFALLRRVC